VRIDFVFATPDLTPTRAEVGPPTSSDHLPVFATLARRPEAAVGPRDAVRAS
jgi:endonuclease/exonuclease/phosphatase (EEP) superfamily protein YafD